MLSPSRIPRFTATAAWAGILAIGILIPCFLAGQVRLSEIMATANEAYQDEDGDPVDWLELHNSGSSAAVLTGYYLTDDAAELRKWEIPALSLAAGARLVIFASGKDRRNSVTRLHTNFRLGAEGEFLALVARDGVTIVDAFSPTFPPQRAGMSYGLDESGGETGYFSVPTPGSANGTPLRFVAPLLWSEPPGYREEAFDLFLSSSTEGARIRFTTDGRPPTLTVGSDYTGSIRISRSTVIRARAFRDGWEPSEITTASYLFTADIATQSNNQAFRGFPANWVNASGYSRSADYEVDSRVVSSYWTFEEDLKSIPAVSVVMDPSDLFDTDTGIYANSREGGVEWERACSAEFLPLPNSGEEAFQIDCGIRISGEASSHEDKNKKHGLRLLFKSDYGPSKLEFPLFPGSPVTTFDTVVLRSHWGRSWLVYGSSNSRALYLRDIVVHDLLRGTGQPSVNGRFVQVYLNGVYWGLYELVERPTNSFQAEHIGGERDNWDVIKGAIWRDANDGLGDGGHLVDGTLDAWEHLYSWFPNSLSTLSDAHWNELPEWLDLDNFVDYMLVNIYCNTFDWPQKNWYAAALHNPEGGAPLIPFRFFTWDAEHALLVATQNHTTIGDAFNDDRGPGRIYKRLRHHPEFQIRFADRVQKHFFGDGALTPDRTLATFLARAAEIDRAIVGESARWGDISRPQQPYTRDNEWVAERDSMAQSYFPRRTEIVLQQLRTIGLYPNTPAPVPSHFSGRVEEGSELLLSAAADRIYYTLDGSDPRMEGGGIAPNALFYEGGAEDVILVPAGATWRYRDNGVLPGVDWMASDFPDADWASGPAQLGYGENDEATRIGWGSDATLKHPTTWFRHSFNVDDPSSFLELSMRIVADDGAVVYLNGNEVARDNMDAGPVSATDYASATKGTGENDWVPFSLSLDRLLPGTNVLAVEVHQAAPTSSDVSFDLELSSVRIQTENPIFLTPPVTLRARAWTGGEWSALVEEVYHAEGDPREGLALSELHFHPRDPDPRERSALPFAGDDDFEFLELTNVGDVPIDLTGARFSDGIEFAFAAGTSLQPGGFLVLVANRAAFETRYGTGYSVAGEYTGRLANAGESVCLLGSDDAEIFSFSFSDRWYPESDGDGPSLVVVQPEYDATMGALSTDTKWWPSLSVDGSPGEGGRQSTAAFARWRRLHFNGNELANAQVSGLNADPDGDGVPNSAEFALAGDPRQDDSSAQMPQISIVDGRISRFRFVRPVDALPEGWVWSLELSNDLNTWVTVQPTGQTFADGPVAGTETVEFELPSSALDSAFYRIQVGVPSNLRL